MQSITYVRSAARDWEKKKETIIDTRGLFH